MTKAHLPQTPALSRLFHASAILIASFLFCASASAQTFAADSAPPPPATPLPAALPDAPSFTSSSLAASAAPGPQPGQKPITGSLRTIGPGVIAPPQSTADKFIIATRDSFGPSAFLLSALGAGESFITKNTPEFHQGAAGYGRYYWHSFVNQASENYAVEFIVPAITHEDTRYYRLGSGGFGPRTGYAIRRVFVTRKDNGSPTFNYSEFVGAALSAGAANFYYPGPERTFANSAERYGEDLAVDAAAFALREFYPDIMSIFHRRPAPTP